MHKRYREKDKSISLLKKDQISKECMKRRTERKKFNKIAKLNNKSSSMNSYFKCKFMNPSNEKV